MTFIVLLDDIQGILPANEDERRIINQLSTSLFDNFNLEEDVERLCDELLDPPPINFEELLSGIVFPTSPITETEPPECPSPGNITPDLCSELFGRIIIGVVQNNSVDTPSQLFFTYAIYTVYIYVLHDFSEKYIRPKLHGIVIVIIIVRKWCVSPVI